MSRLTFATGKTFVSVAREHFGALGAFYVVIAVTISQFTSNIGVLGIVAEAFAAWTGAGGARTRAGVKEAAPRP